MRVSVTLSDRSGNKEPEGPIILNGFPFSA